MNNNDIKRLEEAQEHLNNARNILLELYCDLFNDDPDYHDENMEIIDDCIRYSRTSIILMQSIARGNV